MKYLALTDPYNEIDSCRDIIRINEDLPEKYVKGEWVSDVELLGVYTGDIESTLLTAAQADEILQRVDNERHHKRGV